MVKNELRLYLKSKLNVIMLICMTIPVVLSYYATFSEKNEWEQQLQIAAADLNIEKTKSIIDGYNGFSYIFNFLFSTDFCIIFFLIIIMGFSCMFGGRFYYDRSSGFGNLLMTRTNYKKYLKSMILAQSIYIVCFLSLYFIILTTITGLIFKFNFDDVLTSNLTLTSPSLVSCLKLYLPQIFLIILLNVIISIITILSNLFFNNKYIIHCVPLFIYFIPFLLASTIGNMSLGIGNALSYLVFDDNLLSIYFYNIADLSIFNLLKNYFFLPGMLLFISVIIYFFNRKHFEERYQ